MDTELIELITAASDADVDMQVEVEIIETLQRLVDLAVAAKLDGTIAFVSCCYALVSQRRRQRLKVRH